MRSWTLAFVLVALATLPGCGYNTLNEQDEAVKAAWSEVVNQYQRRNDLIPNLVTTRAGGESPGRRHRSARQGGLHPAHARAAERPRRLRQIPGRPG
jgi:hypothetical protein